MSQQFASALYVASTWVIPLVIAITFHEASHGYVARLCGDVPAGGGRIAQCLASQAGALSPACHEVLAQFAQ